MKRDQGLAEALFKTSLEAMLRGEYATYYEFRQETITRINYVRGKDRHEAATYFQRYLKDACADPATGAVVEFFKRFAPGKDLYGAGKFNGA